MNNWRVDQGKENIQLQEGQNLKIVGWEVGKEMKAHWLQVNFNLRFSLIEEVNWKSRPLLRILVMEISWVNIWWKVKDLIKIRLSTFKLKV
jgi:hypothetical protein